MEPRLEIMLKLVAREESAPLPTAFTCTVSKKAGLSFWSPAVSLATPSMAQVCLLRSVTPDMTRFQPLPWMPGMVVISASGEG